MTGRRGCSAFVVAFLLFLSALVLGGRLPIYLPLVPDLRLYWVGELFYRPDPVLPLGYLLKAGLYTAAYAASALLAGSFALEKGEVG